MLTYFGIVPHGSLLDVPNAALGFTYYTIVFLAETFLTTNTEIINICIIILNSCAMASSIFLATKLIILGELCLLCWTTHLLNSLLLFYYSRLLSKGKHAKAKAD